MNPHNTDGLKYNFHRRFYVPHDGVGNFIITIQPLSDQHPPQGTLSVLEAFSPLFQSTSPPPYPREGVCRWADRIGAMG